MEFTIKENVPAICQIGEKIMKGTISSDERGMPKFVDMNGWMHKISSTNVKSIFIEGVKYLVRGGNTSENGLTLILQ